VVAAYGYKLHLPVPSSAYAVAMTLAVAMVAGMLLLRRRLEKSDPVSELGSNGIWLALVVAVMILVNPRQLQYDADISLLAAFVLWAYALRIRKPVAFIGLMVALFVPGLLIPLVVKAPHQYGMYGTFETLAAFALAYWRLWRDAGPRLSHSSTAA
jgi:Ca2+/Na+ antiporter